MYWCQVQFSWGTQGLQLESWQGKFTLAAGLSSMHKMVQPSGVSLLTCLMWWPQSLMTSWHRACSRSLNGPWGMTVVVFLSSFKVLAAAVCNCSINSIAFSMCVFISSVRVPLGNSLKICLSTGLVKHLGKSSLELSVSDSCGWMYLHFRYFTISMICFSTSLGSQVARSAIWVSNKNLKQCMNHSASHCACLHPSLDWWSLLFWELTDNTVLLDCMLIEMPL